MFNYLLNNGLQYENLPITYHFMLLRFLNLLQILGLKYSGSVKAKKCFFKKKISLICSWKEFLLFNGSWSPKICYSPDFLLIGVRKCSVIFCSNTQLRIGYGTEMRRLPLRWEGYLWKTNKDNSHQSTTAAWMPGQKKCHLPGTRGRLGGRQWKSKKTILL